MERSTGFTWLEVLQALAAAVADKAARILYAMQRAGRERRARRELHRLSDHMLRDIGLQRGQIDALYRE